MANTHNLFSQFNGELQITASKRDRLMTSRDNLRKTIKKYFDENHSKYKLSFYIQGSYKMGTSIRTKDDTCDLDDGVYFKNNPEDVDCKTLQSWVKDAVDGIVDSTVTHKKKCITVDYKAGYNIDLPVYLFDQDIEYHPRLAIKDEDWRLDDPKEMVEAFQQEKRDNPQLVKIVRYLKAWCDHKRDKMPCGLAMTILAMNNHAPHDRDDVSLKNTLIEIERILKYRFQCIVPATPHDDIFKAYSEIRKTNFMNNLSAFIADAKKAVDDEKNKQTASLLWRKHLGDRFPIGADEDEKQANAEKILPIIGNSKPYAK